MRDAEKHWLVRQSTIRYLWLALSLVLTLTLVAGLFVHQHQHFGWEDIFGFYAWYGFLTCIGMVVFAKVLGVFLKRRDDYYLKPGDGDE
jgi:hypothetical protein